MMRTYADLVGQCINDVLALPQFRHIEPVQVEDGAEVGVAESCFWSCSAHADTPLQDLTITWIRNCIQGAPSSLSIAFDDAAGGAEVDMDAVRGKLDIWGLLVSPDVHCGIQHWVIQGFCNGAAP